MNVVLDTSVLIAAFYRPVSGPSFSREVYDYLVEHATVYVSPTILDEFQAACRKKLRLDPRQTASLIDLLLKKLHLTEGRRTPHSVLPNITIRDETDRHLLEFALILDAQLLLTWDHDLLVLEQIGGLRIVTPKHFWAVLR